MPGFPDWQRSAPGEFAVQTVVGADPAAGNEFSVTVTAGQRWRVISVTVRFNPSATAVTRAPRLRVLRGATTVYTVQGAETVAASTNRDWQWDRNAAEEKRNDTGQRIIVPAGPMVVEGGDVIGSVTTNLQTGDNYGAPTIVFERLE